jgi:apolipoprotein N-acyltransferase
LIPNLLLAVASSALLVLVYPEFDFRWLAPIALVPLLVAAAREPVGWKRLAIGELAGIVYWYGVCHWIRWVLLTHGGMSEGLSWLAIAIFSVAKGAHMAVFTLLAGWLLKVRWWGPLLVAALWVGLERTHGPLGFAWLTLGNGGVDMSIPTRLAPLVGVYGVSFVFAFLSALVAHALRGQPRRELAPVLAAPLLFLLPSLPDAKAPDQSAVAMQPNIEQQYPVSLDELRKLHSRMSAMTLESALNRSLPPPSLLLWPEMPAPFYYYEDKVFREDVTQVARLGRVPFLFGSVSWTPARAPLNSAILLDVNGQFVSRYDKMFLVPFGEFVPPLFNWVNRITKEAGDFQPGESVVVPNAGDHKIGTVICYESAFPHLVRQFPARGAEVLINMTNDGYFGRTSARQQHLLLARMRAIENQRWLLRPTNDGITVSIDPGGRIIDRMPPLQERAGRLGFSWIAEQTPYTRFGDWFAWSCLALGVGVSGWIAFRTRRPG